MEIKIKTNKVLYNKLKDHFKNDIKLSIICYEYLIIITEKDLFYCIDISDEKIPSFIMNDKNSIIDSKIVKDLSYKGIIDLSFLSFSKYCFARNTEKIFSFDLKTAKQIDFLNDEKISDMCCGEYHLLLLTQNGKVYENKCDKYQDEIKSSNFELKYFKTNESENEKIVMISCGLRHSLVLTKSGRVFGWGYIGIEKLGVYIQSSDEPLIIELNDLKIKKISCGPYHSLLLSRDGDIYAFGGNLFGALGNGTTSFTQRIPIKVEHKNKFIDIATHNQKSISMSQSEENHYYIWGDFGDQVLAPKLTKFQSFEDILMFNDIKNNCKAIGKLIEFEDAFVRNGFYQKNFQEISELGNGSYGHVFKANKNSKFNKCHLPEQLALNALFSQNKSNEIFAIKKMKFNSKNKEDVIREYLNLLIIKTENSTENEYFVKHFDAWFENTNTAEFLLYIQMELCDKTLDNVVDEIDRDVNLKTDGILTKIGFYVLSQLFIQILEGVNHLHTLRPEQLIHRDLKPENILLKKCANKGLTIKIADFGLMAIHKFSEQSHTIDKGTPKYMAPEVVNSKKYDTKADVYSLGIILEKIFDLEMNKSYYKNKKIPGVLKIKFYNCIELCNEMTQRIPQKRPDCEKILNRKKSWALNDEELKIDDQLKSIIASDPDKRESLIQSLLKVKKIS